MISIFKKIVTLAIILSLATLYILIYSFDGEVFYSEYNLFEELSDELNLNNLLCKRNDLSFANKIARDYMKADLGRTECKEINNFVKIKDDITHFFEIKLNVKVILKQFRINEQQLSCAFQLFDKTYNVSEHKNLDYFEKKLFEKSKNYTIKFEKHGYYYLSCFKLERKKEIILYDDSYLILPHNMSKLIEEKNNLKLHFTIKDEEQVIKFLNKNAKNKIAENKMNVLMIMIDSMSYPHFKRSMPKTYDYLKNKLENNILYSSMNIVGENTLPNVLASMSGVCYEGDESLNITAEQSKYETVNDDFFDKFPIIWKEYEKLGYLTGYNVR